MITWASASAGRQVHRGDIHVGGEGPDVEIVDVADTFNAFLVSALVVAAANLRMGRKWTKRQHKAHTISGQGSPAMSPAMVAAAKAQKRALGRRKRKQPNESKTGFLKARQGGPGADRPTEMNLPR